MTTKHGRKPKPKNAPDSPVYLDPFIVGANIKRLRQGAGLSRRAVAEWLGLTESYLSHVETGKNVPSFQVADAMAQLFWCSTGDFSRGASTNTGRNSDEWMKRQGKREA